MWLGRDMHPTQFEINDFVDGSLSASARSAVAEHLEGCTTCRQLVDDLGELRRAAAGLEPVEPPPQVWTRIEKELRLIPNDKRPVAIQPSTAASRWMVIGRSPTMWLGAAAAVVMLAVGLSVRMGYFAQPGPTAAPNGSEAPTAQSVEAELLLAEQHYQNAINGLEQIAKSENGALDPATANTFQANLAVVDQAISESRAALRTQPNNEPAQQSLLASFKAKIGLLQDTVALINEMRKGNEAGAARIVSGLQQP
jgi:anti-sigma factor RsiW